MELTTNVLELRGLKNSKSKKGNTYYILNCETVESGDALKFYCPSADVLPEGLKKGDKVKILVYYNNFKNLIVREVKKVG